MWLIIVALPWQDFYPDTMETLDNNARIIQKKKKSTVPCLKVQYLIEFLIEPR